MAAENTLRVYETRTLFAKDSFTGNGVETLQVITGSRLLITLLVDSIDPGATVNLFVDNNFTNDGTFDTIETISLSAATRVKRVLSDFHNLFNFRYTVVGGSASFKVGISSFDNALSTRIDNAIIEVDLHHTVDVNGRFDSVRIGDGVDLLEINPDGSLNVVVGEDTDEEPINVFEESLAIPNGANTTLMIYVVPVSKTLFLSRIDVSGENIARYEVYIDGDLIARKRSYFGDSLNQTFEFGLSSRRGLQVEAGETITIKVLHGRPFSGAFEARLQGLLKG